ncbi:MAG TPA: SMC-Scp complex subunit ScpB [Gemmatales bacterium]|nr:SMC-Scp complex subunit ScpB [Gemmatales bacterium]
MPPYLHPLRQSVIAARTIYPHHDVRELGRAAQWMKRLATAKAARAVTGPGVRDAELTHLEAVLFAADEPLSPRKLASLLQLEGVDVVRRLIKRLTSLYELDNDAFQIVELAGGYQLRTREAFLPWLLKLQPSPTLHLSAAARETMTMIAYRQPATRADLEALRGVSCVEVLRVLLEKGLIRIVGRDKTLGRPVQYGTTKLFLQMVGLKSLEELPALRE